MKGLAERPSIFSLYYYCLCLCLYCWVMAKLSKVAVRSHKARLSRGGDGSLASVAMREVSEVWGSLEELAAFVMLDRPDLVKADVKSVAKVVKLSATTVRYLWFSNREFAALLDWHVVGGVWSVEARAQVLGEMVRRVMSGEDKLGDVVKTAEYLDGKAGIASRRDGSSGNSVVQIALVQEGDGSWTDSHQPLRFGQASSSRAVAATGRTVSAVDTVELDEAD